MDNPTSEWEVVLERTTTQAEQVWVCASAKSVAKPCTRTPAEEILLEFTEAEIRALRHNRHGTGKTVAITSHELAKSVNVQSRSLMKV